ncbi:RNA polymerase sigma-54 factor [candidate division WOR-1 bacterium RIFOXYA12_FULL_43_27]|uniref:RNA polymerase sigma-54 factor n=1 Tax=candidate division WOR-1 bacterium RIFOXYC2_FULL_46_14 TaxID=1802587 RepID=A0A1F4U5D7_UNCSA|nr:MAG: RNA polymerase sigma-54 factor [candidate division WOR-1 bacterium RIFOXYA12_FULL_43_27]OGC20339.1 MAG: RNA polymerase sigma-54 factor [candidate division WOR-1 bacterium RIFOXYB2_FULL_46_45]OGC31924.1 MAG: RNA polymerase sigma-54 factor [candidate division WOR-1 bacterium RIFOXYA2_FULL_46_56]OGC40185.1 MAG: RNA polymerase sigma-54 factor [candidate division WOR-1 bacterium RIFOXYC2_FULL_46_14]
MLQHDLKLGNNLQMMLSPRMLKMLNILSLPFIELVEKIDRESEENPFLEIEKPEVLFEYIKYLGSDRKIKREVDFSEYDGLKNVAAKTIGLEDHLLEQLKLVDLSEKDRALAEEFIHALDPNGYLKNFDEVVGRLKIKKEKAEEILSVIQGFEPDGIAARDLKECLSLQVREHNFDDPELEEVIINIINRHLDLIAAGSYKEIAAKEDVSEEDVACAARFIKENLNPFPARGFSEAERVVVPSFAIEVKDGEIVSTNLEERYGPKIKISKEYEKMLKDPRTDQNSLKFLKEHFEKASEMIENLARRRDTGTKIMDMITERQRNFFLKGPAHFRPLSQKEIADFLGLHPSTISRAIAEKYVQTKKGVLSLKYLCPRGIRGFSQFEIKEQIKKIIGEEDPKKPFSDSQIAGQLGLNGIKLSRRTVTALRDELKIPTFGMRKK